MSPGTGVFSNDRLILITVIIVFSVIIGIIIFVVIGITLHLCHFKNNSVEPKTEME